MTHPNGIAIIGMACRFPGANDQHAYWRNLCDGLESITFLTDEELAAAGVPRERFADRLYVKAASILPDIEGFDAAFFEYSPAEARLIDPQQRLLLELAWEAFEDAGYLGAAAPRPVGVFAGSGGVVSSYLVDRLGFSSELPGQTGGLAHIGNDKDFPSTRISYKLNLTGPSINVQTACSTSLVAVHLACQAILSGECDMALAGAATVRVPQRVGYLTRKGDILSPDGHCRAFDAAAQGTIFGSGGGAVLLKELGNALADRDNIYAVIRGSAINNDGAAKVSYTASSVAGQTRAILEAMLVAEISAEAIGYIECHGTGTIVGDPLEIDALTRAFRTATQRRGFCAIGSVKTNVGHLEQTAGIAGLIKAALALKHGKIPASLNFRTPNPKIDFEGSPFFVNTECRDWPGGSPRLAGVNSLGLGGTNAFVVIGEAPKCAAEATADPPLHLFTLSAKSSTALRALLERHFGWLEGCSDAELPDVCFTLSRGRAHFAHRFATVAGSIAQLRAALAQELREGSADEARTRSRKRRCAFLFSGQGSQQPGMAAELYRHQPLFREVVDHCASLLRDRLERPLLEVIFAPPDDETIHDTAYTQPALFAVQAALVELWRSWGIVPDAVLGHSVGEFAAAYCAGAYTLEQALSLVSERAQLMQALPRVGAMAAIFADEEAVAGSLASAGNIAIAAVNAPGNTVISGEREAVKALATHFSALGTQSQFLNTSHAFHSPLMQPALAELGRVAAAVPAREPQIAWISTVSGRALTHAPGPRYWCEQALKPVRFRHAVQAMGQAGETDFIEVGPGNALLVLGQQCVTEPHGWLASLGNKRCSDFGEILTSVRELYLGGHAIDWDGFNRPYRRRRISLPTYPFERRRHWLDGDNRARARDSSSGETSLAGERLRSALPQTQFEIIYSLARLEYLADHRIYAMPVLPFTVGLAALYDAARQHFGTDRVALANLQYREALVLPESGERFVQSILAPVGDATAELRLVSIGTDAGDRWRTHIVGMARQQEQEDSGAALDSIRERCPCAVSTEAYYRTLRAIGLQYGPSFQAIEEIRAGDGEVLTRVRLPAHLSATDGLHPVLLDACLHIYPALVEDHGNFDQAPAGLQNTYLPIGIERFRSGGVAATQIWAHAVRRREQHDPQAVTIDIAVYREDGSWAATLEGLSLKQLPQEALANVAGRASDWLYELQWTERPQLRLPLPDQAPSEPSGWLILADRGGVGTALAQLLSERGATCRLVTLGDVVGRDGERSWSPDDLVDPFAALVRALMEGARPPVGILNLWALDVATPSTVAELHEVYKVSAGSALALFRALAVVDAHPASPARIWLVSRQAAAALPGDLPIPASGAIWGLGRSAALEHPQSWGGLIDLDAAANSAPPCEAAALLHELLSRDGEDQVALRAGRRFAARLVRAGVADAPKSIFDPEGCYLITGGLGALGVEVAKWLASRHGIRHLLLVSRRGERDPSARPVRDALAGLGAEVAIREVDVTCEADVRALLGWIRQAGYTLKGVVHCAGGLDDGIMLQMDWGKFERVAAPKVVGGWLLHELTRELALDHFVVFSSVLSLIGSAGQTNYTAANAFLDALVARRRAEGLPALALNWGPWDDSGLAMISGERGRGVWRARGTRYISAELGRQVMDRLIGSGIVHAAITLTQWPVFLRQFEKSPLLYSALREEAGTVEETNTAPGASKLKDRLKEASAGERRDVLIAFIRQQAMSTLGISDSIDASRPLRELGLDSLMSVTLVNRLEAALDIRISPVRLIAGPSIEEIVGWILPDLDLGTQKEGAATVAATSTGTAAGWLVSAGRRATPRLRLFCFPFAGGGSAVYHSWAQSLHPSIEVVAVEPPGRLGRIKEQPIADINEFVTQLMAELLGFLDRPFAFFGHCLGGLTMYETARRLIHSGAARPLHLFASGARPPDRILDLGPFEERLTQDLLKLTAFRIQLPPYAQPDDVFAELIRHFNIQATEQLLETPELRELMLPVVRAEFQMAFNYDFVEEPPWDIPITCFAALDDPYVSRSHALGWGRFTNSRLQVHIRQGSHFGVVDDAAFIHAVIDGELRGVG